MAIRREPAGLAGMYGRAAVLAGRGIAARTQAQNVMRRMDRAQDVQLAMLRMKNNNEMVRFREDMDLLTRKRAQAFQLEQIETRARMDSAREERDRQQNLDEIKQGIKAINEYPYMTDEEKAEAVYKFEMSKRYRYTVPTERVPSARERELQLIEQLMGGPKGGEAITDSAKMQTAPDVSLNPYWDKLDNVSKMQWWQIYQDPAKLRMALDRLRQKYGGGEVSTTTTPSDLLTRMMRTEPAAWGIEAARGF